MELPETCLTNVFKIEHLSEISYSVYRVSSTLGSAPAWRVLAKAETNLRRQGKFVTTCSDTLELWLFQIDNGENDVAFSSDSGYNSYDGSGSSERGWEPLVWGLEEKSKDVLHIHELFDIFNPPPQEQAEEPLSLPTLSQLDGITSPGTAMDPVDLTGPSRDVYMMQQLSKQRTPNMGLSAAGSPVTGVRTNSSTHSTPRPVTIRPISKQEMISQNFLLAVLSLLSYRLASSFGWIPLNLCSFLPKVIKGNEDDILSYHSATPSPGILTTLSMNLQDDGSLHIAPKTALQIALQTFAQANISEGAEEDVWLAPSGIIGRYASKNDSDGLSQVSNEWKAYVLKSLADRGIDLDYPLNWIRINIWSDIEGLTEIYWPAALTFVRQTNADSQSIASTTSGTLGSAIPKSGDAQQDMASLATELTWFNAGDSLGFAETWLTSASAREAEKKKRLEARNKAASAPETKATIPAPNTDRSGTIYPTPPDGISGQESHLTPGGPLTAPTPGPKAPEEATVAIVGPPTAPPTTEAIGNSNDMDLDDTWLKDADGSKTDIFGDVQDAGMVGGDGLEDFEVTEDDFGFFDEIGGGDDFADMGLENPQGLSTETPGRPATSHLSENMNDLSLGFNTLGSYAEDKLALVDMDLDLDDIGAAMDMQAEMTHDTGPTDIKIPVISQPDNGDSSSQEPGQGNALVRIDHSHEDHPNDVVQVETPPLSPQRAMKLLLLDPKSPKTATLEVRQPQQMTLTRRTSLYSPVDFPSFVGRSDEKYMAGGRFFCADDDSLPKKKTATTGKFSATFPRIKKYRSSRRPLNKNIIFLDEDEERGDLIPDTGSSEDESTTTEEYESEDDDMFEVGNDGDRDSSSYSNSLSPEGFRHGIKRKRNARDSWGNGHKLQGLEGTGKFGKRNELDVATEWSTSDIATINDKDIDNLSSAQRTLCDFNSTDISLEGIFSFAPDNDEVSMRTSPQDFSHIVSLLQEQVVWNTHLISMFSPGNVSQGQTSSLETDANGMNEVIQQKFNLRNQSTQHQDDVEDVLVEIFGPLASRCSLDTLIYGAATRPRSSIYGISPHSGAMEIQGISMSLTPANRPKSAAENDGSHPLFKISAPHVHIHRNAAVPNGAIELLPPALQFWDTFGLAPHSGPKDFLLACVFPKETGITTAARAYLDAISSTYENCRLGESLNLKTSQIVDGLHGVPLSQPQEKASSLDEKTLLRRYCEGIASLGDTLVEIEDELQNVVLLVVNPFDAPSSVLDICTAFHNLKKTYVTAFNASLRTFPNNIVLQIVPVKHLAVHDGLVFQSHNQTIRCALEIYERCTQTIQDHLSQTFPQETYSPAVILTKPPPKSIAFKVSSDPSPAILQENMCLHMAYAQSVDERWISVAWGDDCGEIKEVANFCLGIPGTVVLRPFEDISREIWATTNHIISRKRIHWRISLVKIGSIDEDEIDIWTKLSTDSIISNTLTIFSSDPSPPLTFKSSIASLQPHAFNGQVQLVGTPGATPQSSGVSPDQFGASSQGGALTPGDTPAPEIDNEIALVDFTDETWGAILQHPLNNSESSVKTRPALASGYLIKRTGTNETDEPALLAISLIRVGQRNTNSGFAAPVTKSNEDLLREILTQYRGLVTLAQHFGVIDMTKEVLPWHIAAVVKCRDVFSCVL